MATALNRPMWLFSLSAIRLFHGTAVLGTVGRPFAPAVAATAMATATAKMTATANAPATPAVMATATLMAKVTTTTLSTSTS